MIQFNFRNLEEILSLQNSLTSYKSAIIIVTQKNREKYKKNSLK